MMAEGLCVSITCSISLMAGKENDPSDWSVLVIVTISLLVLVAKFR